MISILLSDRDIGYDFSQSFSDPDGDALTYSIVVNDDGIGHIFMDRYTGLATITPLAVGQTTVTLTASDGISGEVSYSFILDVK